MRKGEIHIDDVAGGVIDGIREDAVANGRWEHNPFVYVGIQCWDSISSLAITMGTQVSTTYKFQQQISVHYTSARR